jgi:DnaJ-class molecular chaperone
MSSLSRRFSSLILAPRKYYDLLEVQPDASENDLKKAYRKK